MRLKKISLEDKPLFDKYLGLSRHSLSVYAFGNIFIWRKLFDIEWALIEKNLCVFFRDNIGCFQYLAPLGRKITSLVIKEAFCIMDRFNKNKEVSRIENLEKEDLGLYKNLGYLCREKSCDFLCSRSDLAGLKGDNFKSKRASYNYFTKHNDFEVLAYTARYKEECLDLYQAWMRQRLSRNADTLYQGMLKDSLISLKVALDNFDDLGYTGIIVKIDGRLKGFSMGYGLNKDIFCILYEFTDLTVKGLAQFIFREFSCGLKGYNYINIMDDSGLENLKKVKMSYHPVGLIPAYIAKRK